jgi:hypothetical protein
MKSDNRVPISVFHDLKKELEKMMQDIRRLKKTIDTRNRKNINNNDGRGFFKHDEKLHTI